jgi:predicted DNA-binding protein (MmcQ/YjbR family)
MAKGDEPLGEKTAALKAVLDAMPGAVGAAGPGPSAGVLLYKVMGKMFAILSVRRAAFMIVKCDPHLIDVLKGHYRGVGHRGHLDRRLWIAVDLDADVPLSEAERLAHHSYDLVRASLTKRQKAELAALSG